MISDEQINEILRQTARDFPRAWSKAHHQGDPEAWDFITLASQRLFAASGGRVRANWRRGVVNDLSMDGISVQLEDGQWYFADVIAGAGGPNPQVSYRRPGPDALLRNAAGQYIGEAGAADPRALRTHFDYGAQAPASGSAPPPPPADPPAGISLKCNFQPAPVVDLSAISAKLDSILQALAEVRAEVAEATKAARFAETAATEARLAVEALPKPVPPPVYRSKELPVIGTISLHPAED
jgi:hypothetical protein